ncbi:hypothetical protein [Dongshaea marina]|uniref:hypothetical protein n=1 Tax=Dongshaea marina TaxID=2047966 RepID=UPI000D3EA936|nr:hypothetical protein [Dongshaea marina]
MNKKPATAGDSKNTVRAIASPRPAKVTVVTSTQPARLTKSFHISASGEMVKESGGQLVTGSYTTQEFDNLSEFSELLTGLDTNQALIFGVSNKGESGRMMSEKEWIRSGTPADVTLRQLRHFGWSRDKSVLMLDYDPQAEAPALSRDELVSTIRNAIPELQSVEMLWWCSSSSNISNTQTEKAISGVRGQRLYLLVDSGARIADIGKLIDKRLWATGYGYFAVSSSGSLLKRSLVDTSVWQPNRLDFAAGAECKPPLQQSRGLPVVIPGDNPFILTESVLESISHDDLSKLDAQVLEQEEQKRAEARPQQLIKRNIWLESQTTKIVDDAKLDDREVTTEEARELATRALDSGILTGSWLIQLTRRDGVQESVPVGRIMDRPALYHGAKTKDPTEPEYDGGRWVGKLYLMDGRPTLYSQAHGGKSYKLLRQVSEIELVSGKTVDATQRTIELMSVMPDIFDHGDKLVQVSGGVMRPFTQGSLRFWLGQRIQYWSNRKLKNGELTKVNRDAPKELPLMVLELGRDRGLQQIKAVVTAPVLTHDGRLLNRPGLDSLSGIFCAFNPDDTAPVPSRPSEQQMLDAVDILMRPFQDFAFCTPLDRSVLMAALLSAAIRLAVSTCPGFAFDAPIQGSGKTLLARCVGALCTGSDPAALPPPKGNDEGEVRKRLTALLSEGSRYCLWDNVLGVLDSAAIAAAFTSASSKDRILGQSSMVESANHMLFVITGNNVSLGGDMPRRVYTCRINPETDRPYARRFNFDPLQHCLANRQQMVAAALTIIRYRQQSQEPLADGSTASFEQWDDMVRQPIALVSRLRPQDYGDVMEVMNNAQRSDPEQEDLLNLIRGVHACFGVNRVTAADIKNAITGDRNIRPKAQISTNQRDIESLKDALESICGRPAQQLTSKTISRTLQNRNERLVQGCCLRMAPSRKNGASYWVEIRQNCSVLDSGLIAAVQT